MAVAVKTSSGARSPSPSAGLVLYSLAGVAYLILTIAVVFKLVPMLWETVWTGLGGGQATVVGATFLVMLELAAAAGLLYGGARLLGRAPIPGIRAGVFVGFIGLVALLLVTRWIGRLFEGYVFDSHVMDPNTGAILTGVVSGALLAAMIYGFTRPWTLNKLVQLEEGGWFHATVYKGNQGRLVRRGTMLGILLLVGTGIYSLMHSGVLHRGPAEWALTIPFTGRVAVESMGDAREFVREQVSAPAKSHVQVKWLGDERGKVAVDQLLTVEQFQVVVKDALTRADGRLEERLKKADDQLEALKNREGKPDLAQQDRLEKEVALLKRERESLESTSEKLDKASKEDPTEYLQTLNRAIHSEFEAVVPPADQADFETKTPHAGFHADIRRRLYETSRQTGWDDLTKLLAAVKKEAETAKKTEEIGWVTSVPQAILVVDRAALQKANAEADSKAHVIVGVKRNPEFRLPEGKMVETSAFDAEEKRVYVGVASRGDLLGSGNPKEQKLLEELKDDSVANGADFRKKLSTLIEDESNEQTKNKLNRIEGIIAGGDNAGDKGVPSLVPQRVTLSKASG